MSSEPNHGTRPPARAAVIGLALVTLVLMAPGRGATPKFFPDDPIQTDADTVLDAGGAAPNGEGSNLYDFAEHTFLKPGDRTGGPARNASQARRFFDCRCLSIHFRASRSLLAGCPRSQQITKPVPT